MKRALQLATLITLSCSCASTEVISSSPYHVFIGEPASVRKAANVVQFFEPLVIEALEIDITTIPKPRVEIHEIEYYLPDVPAATIFDENPHIWLGTLSMDDPVCIVHELTHWYMRHTDQYAHVPAVLEEGVAYLLCEELVYGKRKKAGVFGSSPFLEAALTMSAEELYARDEYSLLIQEAIAYIDGIGGPAKLKK